jgi:hypothetical protein
LKTLLICAGGNMHQAQARYKESFDKNVRPKNSEVKEGEEVFLRVEGTEVGRNHKLESLVQGPYRVLENAGATFRLRISAEDTRVSSDPVTPAPRREYSPPPEGNPTSSEPVPRSGRRDFEFSAHLPVRRATSSSREEEGPLLTSQRPRKRPEDPLVRSVPRRRGGFWWKS